MSDYIKATNFASKDTLPVNDPDKKVKGVEIDNEFNELADVIETKANLDSPSFTNVPEAPTAAVGTNTTQLATTAFVQAAVPSGVIVMWSGSIASIPSGWVLCNGSNGTPDLRNRFVAGASGDGASTPWPNMPPDATGGSEDAVVVSHNHGDGTLATDTEASHAHGAGSYETNTRGSHNHSDLSDSFAASTDISSSTNIVRFVGGATTTGRFTTSSLEDFPTDGAHSHDVSGSSANAGAHSHDVTGSTASEGVSGTNKNLPPYYALAYIMKS